MKLLTALDRGLGLVSSTNMAVNNLPSVPKDLMPPLTSYTHLDSYTHLVDVYALIHINKPKYLISAQVLLAVKTSKLGD